MSHGFVYFHMDPIFYHSFDDRVGIHMPWISIRRGILVIITPQIHSTRPELRFCIGLNPACGVSEIRNGEDLWQFSRLEIRLNVFRRSTIPQKQFSSSYLFTILERMLFKILLVSLLTSVISPTSRSVILKFENLFSPLFSLSSFAKSGFKHFFFFLINKYSVLLFHKTITYKLLCILSFSLLSSEFLGKIFLSFVFHDFFKRQMIIFHKCLYLRSFLI